MSVDVTGSAKMSAAYRILLIIDVVILTVPLVYLPLTNGNMTLALGYVIGAPIVVVISMFILGWIDGTKEAEDF